MASTNALQRSRQRRYQQEKTGIIGAFIALAILGGLSLWGYSSSYESYWGFDHKLPAVTASELDDLCAVLAEEGDTFSLYLAATIGREKLNLPSLEPEFYRVNGLKKGSRLHGGMVYAMPKGMEIDLPLLKKLRAARLKGQFYNR